MLTERPEVLSKRGTDVQGTPRWYVFSYSLVIVVTVGTRLWDLGSRAMHHDESLHAYFSWLLANGHGYIHDPMMHGPVLFHLVAAAYYLLGDTEAISRLWPAVLGIGIVTAPHFLRPWLGPRGAIAAAALLCVSPLTMYFSRFIRHDILAEAWALMALTALLRYLNGGGKLSMAFFGLGVGLLFSEKEVSYIYAASLAPFVAFVLLLRHAPLSAATLAVSVTVPVAVLLFGSGPLGLGPPPEVPYPIASYAQALSIVHKFAGNRLVLALSVTSVAAMAACVAVMVWEFKRRSISIPWSDLNCALLISVGTFIVFHTTFFQNPMGLVTGSFGALAYWLSQQEVRRGDQPWFYYLVLLPIYEPLAIALAMAAVGPLLSALRRSREWLQSPLKNSWSFGPMVALWLLLSLIVYAWAGEKMPWLSVHILLPAVLLGAWGLEHVWPRVSRTKAILAIALGTLAVLGLYQWRSAIQLSFYNGDVAREMAVYTQTTPDVARLARALDLLSQYRGGYGLKVAVDPETAWPFQWYLRRYQHLTYLGSGQVQMPKEVDIALVTSLPEPADSKSRTTVRMALRWWFPEETYRAPTTEGSVIIQAKQLMQAVFETLWIPQQRAKLLAFLLYRHTPPLGSTDFYLLVRPELWPAFQWAWQVAGS